MLPYSVNMEHMKKAMMNGKQGYAFKNWVEGLSDETYYPWESPKKFD